jgi:Helicase associated domain
MSQKRKTYPPTEGETEDTEVIVEPTTAVQKRSRTTLRGGKIKLEDGTVTAAASTTQAVDRLLQLDGLDADKTLSAVVEPVIDIAPTATSDECLGNTNIADDNGDETKAAVVASSGASNNVKKKSASPNLEIPLHLNPYNQEHFDHFLFYLLVLRAESDTPGQTICKEGYPLLYAWLQNVKKEYKLYVNNAPQCQLTPQQVSVLESLHVPLTSRGDDHWNRYYELLVQYRNRHGHVLVPRLCEVPGLGDWVTDQRRQYKAKQQGQPSQMTLVRQEMLEDLEFVWHVRNRPEWVSTVNVC